MRRPPWPWPKPASDVIPIARSEDALRATTERIEATGSETLLVPRDVTDRDGIERLFEEVEDRIGNVDVLVNNAGVNPYFGSTNKLDAETWEYIFSVNVQGAFTCAQQFGRRIAE